MVKQKGMSSRQMSSLYKKKRKQGKSKKKAFAEVGKAKVKSKGASIEMQKQWQKMGTVKRAKARTKYKDSDKDGVPNKWDCEPRNKKRQDSNEWTYQDEQELQEAEERGDYITTNNLLDKKDRIADRNMQEKGK